MSSSFITNNDDYPNRRTMSSPAPSSREASQSQDLQDVSVRRMRLKVLYTFDDQNKTNCLARWPQVLNIRTACLDETTQIGVIELKTCIQAIVAASPELVAKLGQDYTVYAYDYSEYETPLVGQGMLSWVLASASTTPSAPALQSRTVVTGRVCKNILGLFSNGAQETLEVKLRLVPVPTCLQSEYLDSMRKYRDLSKIMPEGFDAQAWTNFLQANPGILTVAEQSRSGSPISVAGQREVGIEHVQRLLNGGYATQNPSDQGSRQRRDSFASMDEQVFYRGGSPAPSPQSNAALPPQLSRDQTMSRASNRDEGRKASRGGSVVDTGYASNDDRFEEGPAKKRAKVSKADWPVKNSFGKQVDSLRVAASTAASVRVFQPTAVRPPGNPANSLEEPPRAPTPIPRTASQSLRPPQATVKSSLGRMSFSMDSSDYTSPYESSEMNKPADSAMTSPEDCRTSCAPCDPPSSPPVIPGISPTRGFTPTPSSPALPPLPPLPNHTDSGFMSGTLDDIFGDGNDEEDRPVNEADLAITAQYSKRTDMRAPAPNKQNAVPEIAVQAEMTQQEKDAVQSRRQARNAAAGARNLSRTASSGSLKQPAIPATDPIRPVSGTLQRSQTWSGREASHPASDMPTVSEGMESTRPKSRTGCHAKRKKAIQSRLATSIAAGEIPPFCDNCGAIETPTWRKAYYRIHSGGTELVQLSDEEGGIVACVVMDTNEDGSTKLFKILKKSLLKSDKDFTEVLLCNPCGLWLHNHKCMRPRSYWEQRKDDKPRRGGSRKKSNATDQATKGTSQELSTHSASSPLDGAADDSSGEPDKDDEPELPPMKRQRAMSAQTALINETKSDSAIAPTAVAALHRAIQSSPGRFLGTKHVPIELDDPTPKPTRRVLFPSPKNAGAVGLLACNDIPAPNRNSSNATRAFAQMSPDTADKENQPPLPSMDDPFNDLFEDFPQATSCPSSPSPSNQLPPNPFKTPTKSPSRRILTTDDFFSSAAKAFLHPPPRTPSRAPHKQPLGEMTPFTRHLHELLGSEMNISPSARFTPSRYIDFSPSLPPLGDAGDVGSTPGRLFRSEDFDFGALASEGLGMPSSPPAAWFGVYEDPVNGGGVDGGWGDLGLGSSPFKDREGEREKPTGGEDVAMKVEGEGEG
ncbi:hypothetical protein MMC30_006181 [Trapelia coarctata]|nr:hypothetical protein [Trapelia coarctata]